MRILFYQIYFLKENIYSDKNQKFFKENYLNSYSIKFYILLLIIYKTKRKDNLYTLITEKNSNIFENIHYLKMRSNISCFYQELINIFFKKLALKESNIDFYLKCENLNLLFPKLKIFIKNHKDLINKSTSKNPQCISDVI